MKTLSLTLTIALALTLLALPASATDPLDGVLDVDLTAPAIADGADCQNALTPGDKCDDKTASATVCIGEVVCYNTTTEHWTYQISGSCPTGYTTINILGISRACSAASGFAYPDLCDPGCFDNGSSEAVSINGAGTCCTVLRTRLCTDL